MLILMRKKAIYYLKARNIMKAIRKITTHTLLWSLLVLALVGFNNNTVEGATTSTTQEEKSKYV